MRISTRTKVYENNGSYKTMPFSSRVARVTYPAVSTASSAPQIGMRASPTEKQMKGVLVENIQRHRVLETGSEWDSLALYIVRHAPTLQTDNHRTLGGPMRASDRSGTRALLTAAACTGSTIWRFSNRGMALSRRKAERTTAVFMMGGPF